MKGLHQIKITIYIFIYIKSNNLNNLKFSYRITFESKPGLAMLEGTVQVEQEEYKMDSPISRLNSFGEQSLCIDNHIDRMYCFCK